MALRARKTGDQFKIEQKLEQRYDKEEELGTPTKLLAWIDASLTGEPGYEPCGAMNQNGSSWHTISDYIKDGVVLCKILNKVRQAAGMDKIKFKSNAKTEFAKMDNVEAFNRGAAEYGVASSALFQTTDLMDGRKGPMIHVIGCLNQLGFEANSKGFSPRYEHVAPPTIDSQIKKGGVGTYHATRNKSRATKSGDMVFVERKLEKDYDGEEERGTCTVLVEWINRVLAEDPQFTPCAVPVAGEKQGKSWVSIEAFLRDGVIICKLVNRLRAAEDLPLVPYNPKPRVEFAKIDNVEMFNRGASDYGVPDAALFDSIDLLEGRKGPLCNVIRCLSMLGVVANRRGFLPIFEAVQAPVLQ